MDMVVAMGEVILSGTIDVHIFYGERIELLLDV
jgi:hypothetical protein